MALFKHFLKFAPKKSGFTKCSAAFKIHEKYFSSGAYDPDGKTVLNILNNDETAPLMINGYTVLGFRLNNGIFVVGPIAIFPSSILSWNITDDRDINERSLSLFLNLWPRLDVLLIGLSDATDQKFIYETRKNVYNIVKSKGYRDFNIEIMPTEKAVSTFNFLNGEKRYVGAALVPPTVYAPNLDDEYRASYLSKKREEQETFLDR